MLLKIVFVTAAILAWPVCASTYSHLSEHSYWLKLGHYRPATLTDWKSEVDDAKFFISDVGRTDPHAELIATIEGFNGKSQTSAQTQALRCAYPARYNWLKNKIKNNWPALNCKELNTWQQTINPKSITLVFPTAFMNSPSSMFGHTLLRINAKDQNRDRELVAFAVNFAATPDSSDNAATYAYKGLVGQYPGKFTLMPYYRKVREYNDIESRDIWEYQLNFSEQEVNRILLHLWELQRATFDYYFIDENCSYQLLGLLQLANETLDLTADFPYQAIPADTVAALNRHQLLQSPNYRPAFGTRLHHYAQQLSSQELAAVRALIETGEFNQTKYTEERQAAMLEVAYEWLNFDFNDQGLSRKTIAPKLNSFLFQRSKIKTPTPFSQPVAPAVSPEQGHGSSRIGISHVESENYVSRTHFSYRLAYHDLLDHSAGYIPGAKISFLDLEASFSDFNESRIEQLYLIDAMSLAPDNAVFDSWSWNIRLGYDRQPANVKRQGRLFAQGGYGKSFGNPNHLFGYALASVEFNGGDINNEIESGVGTELGTVWQPNVNNKFALTSKLIWLMDAGTDHHSEINLAWNYSVSTNLAIRTSLNYQHWHTEEKQAKVNLYYYF